MTRPNAPAPKRKPREADDANVGRDGDGVAISTVTAWDVAGLVAAVTTGVVAGVAGVALLETGTSVLNDTDSIVSV